MFQTQLSDKLCTGPSQVLLLLFDLQRVHRWEVFITRGAEGKTGRAFVADMTEEKSIELASKLVSEGFVFTVSIRLVWVGS